MRIYAALAGGLPFAAGRTLATRSMLTRELEATTARLQDEQEVRAARAAAEERNRIARELHDVIAHNVTRRTAEIGVRIALGASRGNVVRMIIGEAARLVIPGLILGGIVCAGATRLLRSLLYETKPMDPMTVTLSLVAIVAIAIVASCLPAHHASRIDPMQALRAD